MPDESRRRFLTALGVAAQAVTLRQPLSARLFLIAGKAPGDPVHFDDPVLTDSVVFRAS